MALKNGKNGLPKGSGLYWKRGVIYAAIRHDGKKHVFSTGKDDVKEALKFRDEKKADLIKGDHVDVAKAVRISHLFADYIEKLEDKEREAGVYMKRKYETTSYRVKSRINKHLIPAFGNFRPEDLTEDDLKKYKKTRTGHGASIVTVNTEFRLLRAALRRAAKGRNRKINPLHIPSFDEVINNKLEAQRAQTGIITLEQYRMILKELADHLKPFFACAYWTGVRLKELKFLLRSDVAFKENKIYMKDERTKAGGGAVGMNVELMALLLEWEERTKREFPTTPWLFHYQGEQLDEIKTGWNAALKRCGLRVPVMNEEGTQKTRIVNGKKHAVWKNVVKFHDARRAMNTLLADDGVSEEDRMSQSRHSNNKQNRKYNQSKAAADRVRIAQNKILRLEGREPAPAAPSGANGRWKAELKELKETFESGLLPEDLYRAAVQRVMASR